MQYTVSRGANGAPERHDPRTTNAPLPLAAT
jgi:hypothetical protein